MMQNATVSLYIDCACLVSLSKFNVGNYTHWLNHPDCSSAVL